MYFLTFYKYFAPGHRPQGFFFLKKRRYLCIFMHIYVFLRYFYVFYKYFVPGQRPQGLFFLKNKDIYEYVCTFMYFLCILMHFGGPWGTLGGPWGGGPWGEPRFLSSTTPVDEIKPPGTRSGCHGCHGCRGCRGCHGSGVIDCCSDPPFHARRGPG